jgi:hypothetical protein
MLEAHRAGLSTLPLRSNKRPAVATWKERTDELPDELTVRREGRDAQGFAICCGGPSRLQVLDFEAGFAGILDAFTASLVRARLDGLFEGWLDGYMVATPSGGFHVAVHVGGDDVPPGNVKLASDGDGHTLVETRGHGGYVVAAPSNGSTHPTGRAWGQVRGSFDTICWATEDEWQAICGEIARFDAVAAASETPPEAPSPRVPAGGVSLSRIEHLASWIDEASVPPMSTVLDQHGWQYSHSDSDHQYWTRPGKAVADGHSASVNSSGRLFVFSSNAAPVPASPGRTTYDSVDVLGCYRLGHLPSQQERVEILRSFTGASGRPPAAHPSPSDGWLSDDFWTATEWLEQIRAAAWAAQRCPEAILGAVLAVYATTVPSSIKVEALVGGNESPLNTYVALVGRSGSGKTGAIGLAMRLCGAVDSQDHRFGVGLRSGAGLVTAAIAEKERLDKKSGLLLPAVYRRGVLVEFDEGKTLAAQNARPDETLLSYLLTAWSGRRGSRVGGTKAVGEESFPADLVRVCAVMGVQLGVAGSLFTGEAASQGFPGRLLYFGMDNPGPREARRRGSPAQLDLPYYYPDQGKEIGTMTFPAAVEDEVSLWDYDRMVNGGDVIDGHLMLLRARNTCLLALLDRQPQPLETHWQLAAELEKHSISTRNRVLAGIRQVSTEHARAAGRMDMVRETARHDAWIEDRAQRLAHFVHGTATQPVAWRRIKDRFNASDRKQLDQIVTYAIERNWVAHTASDTSKALEPGSSRPF